MSSPPRRTSSKKEIIARIILYSLLGLAIYLFIIPLLTRSTRGRTPNLAEAVNNAKQVKLALDLFAMDHDGNYPSATTASVYDLPAPKTSNDYFRQLFAGENPATTSEIIFWGRNSKICNDKSPDDISTDSSGHFAPAKTLQSGDNAWAYIPGQTNVDHPDRPVVVDSPVGASGLTFDKETWNRKSVVARVDGSVKAERLNQEGRLMDGDNKELLTPTSKVWDGTPVRIAYPEPAKR